jgi:proline iminopeptidase
MEIQVQGHSVFVDTVGHGGAFVTLHGGPGLDHTWFRPFLDPLSNKAKVVYYDQADCGRSARDVPVANGFGTWVDELEGLRGALGVDRMVLFGHSAGSFLALEYATRFPDRVAGLVLVSTAAKFDFIPQSIEACRKLHGDAKTQAWIDAVSAPARDDDHFRAIWNQVVPLYFKQCDPRVVAEIDARARYSAAALNYGFGVAAPAYDVRAKLGVIRAPTLILSGAYDWVCPTELGAKPVQQGIAGARLEIFENSAHYPFIEERERFLKVVGGFLDGLE